MHEEESSITRETSEVSPDEARQRERGAPGALDLRLLVDRRSLDLRQPSAGMEDGDPGVEISQETDQTVTVMVTVRARPVAEITSLESQRIWAQLAADKGLSSPEFLPTMVRAPADFAVCLDASGSMQAEDKMNMLQAKLGFMLQQLRDGDRMGIVTFNETATVALPIQFVGEQTFGLVVEVLRSMVVEGRTDLGQGLAKAIDLLAALDPDPTRVRAVVVVTDGLPNVGVTDAGLLASDVCEQLAVCLPATVNLCTFGLGQSHSSEILCAISEAATGAGSYHFIKDFQTIPEAWEDAITSLLQVSAQNVRLRLKPSGPWRISHVHAKYPQKQQKAGDSSIILSLGDLCAGEEKNIILTLTVEHTSRKDQESCVLSGSVKYYDIIYGYANRLDTWASLQATNENNSADQDLSYQSLDAQICRLQVVVALERARALVEKGKRTDAKVVLGHAKQSLSQFQAATQDGHVTEGTGLLIKNLLTDLTRCSELVDFQPSTVANHSNSVGDGLTPKLNETVHTLFDLASSHGHQRLGPYTPRPHYKHLETPPLLSPGPTEGRCSPGRPPPPLSVAGSANLPLCSPPLIRRARSSPIDKDSVGVPPKMPRRKSEPNSPTRRLSMSDVLASAQETLGHMYHFDKVLGRGAHGIILAATEFSSRRRLAVKRLSRQVFDCRPAAMQVLREIRLMRHLGRHRNLMGILRLHASEAFKECSKPQLYLVMGRMDTDLQKVINSSQNLSKDHCCFIAYQLLLGLLHLHSAGALHRDLKPSNLLLNHRCELKIADFGLARGIGAKVEEGAEIDGTAYVVTRWYRAPELLLACQNYGGAVDMWSVGCILAEMVQRRPLFPGNNHIHQLEIIIDALGMSSPDDIGFIDDANTLHFLSSQMVKQNIREHDAISNHEEGSSSTAFLSGCFQQNFDITKMISNILVFNPAKRPTVLDCLNCTYFDALRSRHDIADSLNVDIFDFSFETSSQPLFHLFSSELGLYS